MPLGVFEPRWYRCSWVRTIDSRVGIGSVSGGEGHWRCGCVDVCVNVHVWCVNIG